MSTIDPKKPHLRFVTYKFTTDANGIEQKERTFVLVPMQAKAKTYPTKEDIALAKSERVYISLGMSEKIPFDDTIEKAHKHWDKLKIGKQVIADYREQKKQFDDETTEIITLGNGFKKKIKIKLDFKPLPSMKLSPSERKTRMEEHKKTHNAKDFVRNIRLEAFRKANNAYTYKPLQFDTKARKERQNEFWSNHNKTITKVIEYLRTKKPGVTLQIDKVYKSDTVIPYPSKTVKKKVPYPAGMQTIEKIVKNNKAKDAVHVFGVDRKDKVPTMGMKIAA